MKYKREDVSTTLTTNHVDEEKVNGFFREGRISNETG